jgi:hypothetical protein
VNVTGIEQGSYFLGRLSSVLGGRDLLPYLGELHASPLPRQFERIVADEPTFAKKRFDSIWQLRFYRIWVYALVRELRPAVFVETGVLHGMLSAFVLEAMRVNGHGRLISIDLPSYADRGPANVDGYQGLLPPGREPGWLVPDELRERWDLRLGPSLELLPGVIDETAGQLDVFLHDSDHTHETMSGEFALAWPALNPGGALIADDSTDNSAFAELCERVGATPLLFPNPNEGPHDEARAGLILKPRTT